ncbi:o-succinylbenzoate synthase [Psychromonas sp.]|nr:o-succinylbenzoate synthase [Psychromonas sp.]
MNNLKTTNKSLSLYRFSLPFNQPIHFKGHQLAERQGLWIIEHNPSGKDFIGECCPLPGFSDETLAQCEQQLLKLLKTDTQNIESIALDNLLLPSVSFALSCLQQQIPWQSLKKVNELNSISLLQGDPSEILLRYQSLNYPPLVKLKVARMSIEQEVEILSSLISLNPKIRFRLDANQQWTAQQYVEFLTKTNRQHIDYIEEPTVSLADNLTISEKFNVCIGLDESLLSNQYLPIHPCIKALVIKPTLIGYPERINALLIHAQEQQLTVSISASFESPIAVNQLHYLAMKWQQVYNISFSLGLDTLHVFQRQVTEQYNNTSELQKTLITQATCLWQS